MSENIFTEALNSPKLNELIWNELQSIKTKRHDIPSGVRLKSDAFSSLDDQDLLTADVLKHQFLLILTKQSSLPARERAWITAFMDYIIANTAIYLKQQQITAEEVVKPKRKTSKKL